MNDYVITGIAIVTLCVISVSHSRNIGELRKDVNRVSQIQVQCAEAIRQGNYTVYDWAGCMDDYMHGKEVVWNARSE